MHRNGHVDDLGAQLGEIRGCIAHHTVHIGLGTQLAESLGEDAYSQTVHAVVESAEVVGEGRALLPAVIAVRAGDDAEQQGVVGNRRAHRPDVVDERLDRRDTV